MSAMSDALKDKIERRFAVLGGCVVSERDPSWQCSPYGTRITRSKVVSRRSISAPVSGSLCCSGQYGVRNLADGTLAHRAHNFSASIHFDILVSQHLFNA